MNKPEYEVICQMCDLSRDALIGPAIQQAAARVTLQAVKDRINGVFDSKYLIPYGPLSCDTTEDILYILSRDLRHEKARP